MGKDKGIFLNADYKSLVVELKQRIRSAQLKAAVTVNQELIRMYWYIGRQILEKSKTVNWGGKLLEQLSKDLQSEFPGMRGFSRTNLHRMQQFAENYPDDQIVPQAVGQLPWGHICLLIQRVKDKLARGWYAQQGVENGWSHSL